jgi:hypothetical protein
MISSVTEAALAATAAVGGGFNDHDKYDPLHSLDDGLHHHHGGSITDAHLVAAAHEDEHYVQQSLWELTGNVSCGRRIFLGDVIMDAAPFLYPFLIEYSLIGAAVLYVIWTHIGLNPKSVIKTKERKKERKRQQRQRVDLSIEI